MENYLSLLWFAFGQTVLLLGCYTVNEYYKKEKSQELNILRGLIFFFTFVFTISFILGLSK